MTCPKKGDWKIDLQIICLIIFKEENATSTNKKKSHDALFKIK